VNRAALLAALADSSVHGTRPLRAVLTDAEMKAALNAVLNALRAQGIPLEPGPLAGAREVDPETWGSWVGVCAQLTVWTPAAPPLGESPASTYWVWDGPQV
jgi:hypothetical protein